jgi:hypothetical protein
MNRRRVGEDKGSKEMDGCPLTDIVKDFEELIKSPVMSSSVRSLHLCTS